MTEPEYLAAVRQSYDTVAADYVRRVTAPADLDPLPRAKRPHASFLARKVERP